MPQARTPQEVAASALNEARVEVFQGRAVLAGGGKAVPMTLRRTESMRARGPAHLELPAGSRAIVSWSGTANLEVFGPASIEWASQGAEIGLMFHELSWVDMTVLSGEHSIELPADWHGIVKRSSFRLRGVAGGPTELFLHAGSPVELDWRGSDTVLRPPMAVFPGSSVRLDRPRYTRMESTSARADNAWPVPVDEKVGSVWPWRTRSDTAEQARERMVLGRQTQTFDEIPGSPTGTIDEVRSYQSDGSSRTQSIRSDDTSAQISLQADLPPVVTVTPRRRDVAPAQPRPSFSAQPRAEVSSEPMAKPQTQPQAMPEQAAQVLSQEPSPAPAVESNGFNSSQWRGLTFSALNGSGVVATERGQGVEVRVLGGGRTKVFVSGSSKSARWVFTPFADYLLQPGAVAVLESNGRLRMSFGTIEEHTPSKGRPNFDQLSN